MSDGMTYAVTLSSGLIGSILTLIGTGYLSNKRDVKQKGEEVIPILNNTMNRINLLKQKDSFEKDTLENHYKDFLVDSERIITIMDFHFMQESKYLVRRFLVYCEGLHLNLEIQCLEKEQEELNKDLEKAKEDIKLEEKALEEFEENKEFTFKTQKEYSTLQNTLAEKKASHKNLEDRTKEHTKKTIENKYRLKTSLGTDSIKDLANETQEILEAVVVAIHKEYKYSYRIKRFFN